MAGGQISGAAAAPCTAAADAADDDGTAEVAGTGTVTIGAVSGSGLVASGSVAAEPANLKYTK